MTPPDISLRQLAQGTLRPPALWARLHQIADEVTSLLITNEALHKQNQELVDLDTENWLAQPKASHKLPF